MPEEPQDTVELLLAQCAQLEAETGSTRDWRGLVRRTIRAIRRASLDMQKVLVQLGNSEVLSSDYMTEVAALEAASQQIQDLILVRQRLDSNLVEASSFAAERRHKPVQI